MKRVSRAGLVRLRAWVWLLGVGAVLMSLGGWGRAQGAPNGQYGRMQSYAPRVTATVTGHVSCSDTQRAARFATVTLVGVEPAGSISGDRFGGGFGRRVTARTDLNGDFTVQAEPGDYYVTASATGYASPVAEAAARLGSNATADDLVSKLPQVHVSEDGGGPVNIVLDRGGVISGKLQWDDGSPAAGVNVNAVSATSTVSTAGQPNMNRVIAQLGGGFGAFGGGFQMTDDRGVFRITGLAPGSYLVRATMMTPMAETSRGGFGERMSSLAMYAPGKVRKSDAQTITLKSGEERDDVAFTLDLSALHTVSGHVSSTDEGGTVASGMVRVTDSQDSTLTRMAFIQPDGSFALQWVPAGTYTLAVSNASNTPTQIYGMRGQQSSGGGVTYQPFQETLTVTDSDLTGLGINLTPVTAQ